MDWPYKVNESYSRRADIHSRYGGQQQGGISTPSGMPGIFIFTGHGADKHGYADKLMPDGSYRYTGEGQLGDMSMIRGNRAIRDHALDGKDLLIFEKEGSGAPVHFLGIFACAGWEVEQQPDTVGTMRDADRKSVV